MGEGRRGNYSTEEYGKEEERDGKGDEVGMMGLK
jgi:hypothetical protein